MGRRYGDRVAATPAKGFAQRLAETKHNAPHYYSSANAKAIQDLMIVRAQTVTNGRVLGRTLAFAEYQARNDLNQERRMQPSTKAVGWSVRPPRCTLSQGPTRLN